MKRGFLLLAILVLFIGNVVWAQSLFDEAFAAKERGEVEKALSLFEECIQKGERVLDAYWEAGNLLLAQGRYRKAFSMAQEAIPIFEEYLKSHSEDHVNWFRLGYVFELRSASGVVQEWDKAKECFTKALELQPENSFYLLHLGYVLYKMGNREEAVSILSGILEKYPEDFETRYWLAVVLEAQRRYKEAREELRFILNHAPEGFGRLREAEELLRRVERKVEQ